jgi:hypothetical protein
MLKFKQLWKHQKAQAMTEFALLLPVLLLLICGTIDFGRLLYTYLHLNLVSQETVRLGGLGKEDATMIQFAKDTYHMGNPETLQVQITPTESYRKSGEYVKVTIKAPFECVTPVISQIIPSPYYVTANSTIRVE